MLTIISDKIAKLKMHIAPPYIVKSRFVNNAYNVKVIVIPAVKVAAIITETAVYIEQMKATRYDSQIVNTASRM